MLTLILGVLFGLSVLGLIALLLRNNELQDALTMSQRDVEQVSHSYRALAEEYSHSIRQLKDSSTSLEFVLREQEDGPGAEDVSDEPRDDNEEDVEDGRSGKQMESSTASASS